MIIDFRGGCLDLFILLFLSTESSTLKNDCDCLRDPNGEISCSELSSEKINGSRHYSICGIANFTSGTLLIKNSEDLRDLDLQKDFASNLPKTIFEIRIVNNTQLEKIKLCEDCSEEFPRLKTLDLRNNAISGRVTPVSLFSIPSLRSIYISGNPWSCFSKDTLKSFENLKWLLQGIRSSKIKDEPTCSRPKSDKWHQNHSNTRYQSSNVTLKYFLDFYQTLEDRCPKGCKCQTININRPLFVKVSCIGLNLKKLPEILPPNTSDLDVSYNKLTNLNELRTNSHYFNLIKLKAVKNRITSLSDLRGSPFMKNRPTTINFQNNSIKYFEVDLLHPLFSGMRNKNFHGSVDFLFFGNPWDCSCKNLTRVQQFLYEYKLYLRDADLLACGQDQTQTLIGIDYTRYCETSVDYMIVVIAAEALLLVLVLSRLCYDVINYRRSGELPWLAQHMYLGCSYAGLRKSTLPTMFRNSECQNGCRGQNASIHEEGKRDENSTSGESSSKTSRTFIKKDVFRPKRLAVLSSSPKSDRSHNQCRV